MGDFYETFDGDARLAASVLGIALTSRPMGKQEGRVPLAGIPHQSLERHLQRLVSAGHRVAIVEQVGAAGNGLVERRVVRVVTPGTLEPEALAEAGDHNWLVALAPDRRAPPGAPRYGLAACDVTTGELECQLVEGAELAGEWARLRPAELLLAEGDEAPAALPGGAMRCERPARDFDAARGERALRELFAVASLDGFGLEGMEPAVGAAGALIAYLREGWPQALAHLRAPRAVRGGDYCYMDPQTRRNLELFEGERGGEGSLLETLDRTLTAMGARLLRARVVRPLRRARQAEARLDAVQALVEAGAERAEARRLLRAMPDLERLLGRVRAGSATARTLVALGRGLERLPALRERALAAGVPDAAGLEGAGEAAALVAAALADGPPADLAEGGTVRAGFDAEVDGQRALAEGARAELAELESRERERSGIATLRVGYHRVFGYYLEVPRSRAGAVPEDYEPRQTLRAAQRFRNPALGELESRILGARERLLEAERAVLERVRGQLAAAGPAIERAAGAVARLDVAAALAELAAERGYVRPELSEGGAIEIAGGRHPVVEGRLAAGEFVPNDCALGGDADIVVLTGPNMGGKSTYLRQTALIVLLAQCGAYVPAERARVGVVDRIFSRVGAHDDIAGGRSTFMVEMLETAAIVRNATERSLVVLDEIGRGTSTADGVAIARAVVEHLHHRPGGTPRTLFATHFHELIGLASTLPRVENRCVAVSEEGGEVVFLHRIVEGGADRSYGVHVASLAGMPRALVARARELLRPAEGGPRPEAHAAPRTAPGEALQPELFGAGDAAAALLEELAELDPDGMAPLEALQRLYELRRQARQRLAMEG